MSEGAPRIALGAFAGAHGVRGLAKVKPFTERPEDLLAYGPLWDRQGKRRFELTLKGQMKGMLLVEVAGIADRDAAAALRGVELTVERGALPPPEEAETYYHADLIGLAAVNEAGEALGRVTAVLEIGGGDVLQIEGAAGELLVPFTKAAVPEVDIAAGRLVVVPPETVEAGPEEALEDEPGDEDGKGPKGSGQGAGEGR